MEFGFIDFSFLIVFIFLVIFIAMYISRREKTSEEYFLAGRSLSWPLIGISLIAANISTEHFVGMAGRGFELGLAIASYEWMAAITMVIVAFLFLPRFLRSGIYTIPEYLEYRYSSTARGLMAVFMMAAYVFVAITSVIYSGAIAFKAIFDLPIIKGVWFIGIAAGIYTIYGGLKACVWANFINGIALIVGGIIATTLGFIKIGGPVRFFEVSSDKLHTVLPWNHPEMPWVAVFIGGLWIPNLFYWGLNQFITQNALGAKNLKEAQKGVIFAASIKLLIPFIIVFPGIMAFNLFGNQVPQADQAYPYFIKHTLPIGLRGVLFAALFGAIISSLDSMLNSASTIFTMDLYKRHFNKKASSRNLVLVGRIMTAVFMILGCLWAPLIEKFGSVFQYIQKVWGFISPGIVASFLFGIVIKRAPAAAAIGAMILGIPVYGMCLWLMPGVAFLHHMAITFVILIAYMTAVALLKPLKSPRKMPEAGNIDLSTDARLKFYGLVVITLTVILYIIFR